ncbi:MAG: HAD-IIIA family hydrolase [Bacteroidota bacterium]
MNKAVFLDRDGIINEEIGDYVYDLPSFRIVDGVIELLKGLKEKGFILIVITNQAGIAKGRYGHAEVKKLHDYFQEQSGHLIDKFYYAYHHPDYTSESLSRKPGSLLFEKAIARYQIDVSKSWMVGDKERDLIPARKLSIRTVRVFLNGFYKEGEETIGDFHVNEVKKLASIIG